jgi:hypothetical protein
VPVSTDRPARPRSIRATRVLLLVLAVAGGISVLTAPVTLSELAVDPSLQNADWISTALSAVALVGGAVLWWRIGRGDHRGRVLAWVMAGVLGVGELTEVSADPGWDPDYIGTVVGGWYLPMYFTVEVACLVGAIAIAWLLVTQGARDYFDRSRRSTAADEARVWDVSRIRPVRRDNPDQR